MNLNNINFTGIRNASCAIYIDDNDKQAKIRFLNTQLKNDKNGNDLSEYKNLIKRFPTFKNPFYSNFVNITTLNSHGTRIIQLNGFCVPETDDFLPIFSFIGKLVKKISQLPEDKFICDEQYLKSTYADMALMLDSSISYEMNNPLKDILPSMHKASNVKACASKICKDIEVCMLDYLG